MPSPRAITSARVSCSPVRSSERPQRQDSLPGASWSNGRERQQIRAMTYWSGSKRRDLPKQGGGGAQNGVLIVYHSTQAGHLPGDVYKYMITKCFVDLPALATPDPMTAEIAGTLAGALRVFTQGREAEGANECSMREPKTVHQEQVYKATHRTLLRFCNVAHPEDVAPIWGAPSQLLQVRTAHYHHSRMSARMHVPRPGHRTIHPNYHRHAETNNIEFPICQTRG